MRNPLRSQSNGGTNILYQDLHQAIKTLKDEPDDDFIKPNLTQWDKEQKVPLIDGNGCVVIMCKAIFETEEMILNKAKYSDREGKWLLKYKTNRKSGDDIWPFVEWKTRKKIPRDGKANNSTYKETIKNNV